MVSGPTGLFAVASDPATAAIDSESRMSRRPCLFKKGAALRIAFMRFSIRAPFAPSMQDRGFVCLYFFDWYAERTLRLRQALIKK